MLSIEHRRPTHKTLAKNLDEFERFCMGEVDLPPNEFRYINEELSIGAVLMLGKHRYQEESEGRRLFWKGLDEQEHDMGLVSDPKIMRDYPGFHASRSNALVADQVEESKIIAAPNGNGSLSIVTMKDGSQGIGPNYKMALRNAAIKMYLQKKLKRFSFLTFWKNMWSHA